jgi:hypothetical protein
MPIHDPPARRPQALTMQEHLTRNYVLVVLTPLDKSHTIPDGALESLPPEDAENKPLCNNSNLV